MAQIGRWIWVAALIGLATVGAAEAGCPGPGFINSVDPCLIACPAGDFVFVVIARDPNNTPVAGHKVVIDFSGCPGFQLDPVPGGEPYSVDSTGRRICLFTEGNGGAARFPIRGGGLCGDGLATVVLYCCPDAGLCSPPIGCFPDTFLLVARSVVSPDQDGNLVVDDADVALVQAKVGTSDPSADFDCDGSVTPADLSIAEGHLGHRTPSAVGVPDDGPRGAAAWLGQNWPNPVSGTSRISFELPRSEDVTLKLYDVHGREVAVILRNVPLEAGPHEVVFNAKGLPTGIYAYRIQAEGFTATRLMVVVR